MVKILKIMCRIQIKKLSISTKVTTFGYQSNKMEGNMVVPWYFGAFFSVLAKHVVVLIHLFTINSYHLELAR